MLEHYTKILKDKGLKATPRRNAIITIFLNNSGHLTPEDVWRRLSKEFSKCGLPSVYRNLEILVECGILTKIQQFDRKKHYALCSSAINDEHHHHIVCVKCGKVEDIKECALETKKYINGYKVLNHFVQVNGICEECLV